jgi:hypothetical protein
LARSGIRKRNPEYTCEQVEKQLTWQIYRLSADTSED